MSVVLYVGGSNDGKRAVVPHGFSKTMLETALGPEVYVERLLAVRGCGTVRVMALESLQEDVARAYAERHYAERANAI